MPEHLRALVMVLALGSVVWLLARPAITKVVSLETFARWRALWYVTTLTWFLSPNFWVYVGIMTVVLIRVGRRETQIFGLYLLLLVVAPASSTQIPGFGLINYFFEINHYRFLALVLLLPYAWRLSKRPETIRFFRSPVDGFVVGYLVLNSLLAFRFGNFTSDARSALMMWIDFFLPYYVASRSIRDAEGFRHALVGLVLGGVLLSVMAVFEVLRSWKLYDASATALGLNPFGIYKLRGGFIRPSVTVIESIVLGYTIVVAAGAYLYLQSLVDKKAWRLLGWVVLATGILASLSRGPWVGAGILFVVFVLTSPRPLKRLTQTVLFSSCAFLVMSMTPSGEKIIDLLPIVGSAEQGNVDYRADLLTVSRPVIERNLLFGSTDFWDSPELQVMRQGEGIIDIVNSYLGVALQAGLVGLFLYTGMFVGCLLVLRRGMQWARQAKDSEALLLGRALFSSVVAVMLMIFTLSSILLVPTTYFALLGTCCAYALWMQPQRRPYL